MVLGLPRGTAGAGALPLVGGRLQLGACGVGDERQGGRSWRVEGGVGMTVREMEGEGETVHFDGTDIMTKVMIFMARAH